MCADELNSKRHLQRTEDHECYILIKFVHALSLIYMFKGEMFKDTFGP